MFLEMQEQIRFKLLQLGAEIRKLISDERGEFVGTIGWMALIATVLVLAHGLIRGWLPTFINKIFTNLELLV